MPADQRRIVRDLRAGRTVELIGEDGMPRVRWAPVSGSEERFALGPDGHATLSSHEYGGVDLVAASLPLPVRFEVEVALLGHPAPGSWAGAYAGGVGWPGGAERSQVQVTISEDRKSAPGGDLEVKTTARAGIETRPPGTENGFAWRGKADETRTERAQHARPLYWHRVAFDITPDRFTPRFNRAGLPAVDRADLHARVPPAGRSGLTGLFEQPSLTPDAFGLVVHGCGAAFRNAKLTPLVNTPHEDRP